ncbi:hypothetical protein DIPPA_05878 [Diplonema papillatum]|nr:hypothetical protein DIPPA_05878 [Diplonema papillatum]
MESVFSVDGITNTKYDFEFPRGIVDAFREKVGEPRGRRTLDVRELIEWAAHHVKNIPESQHEGAFKAVIAAALGIDDSELEGIKSANRVAAMAREIWEVNPGLFEREARLKGCWQKGEPAPAPFRPGPPRPPRTPPHPPSPGQPAPHVDLGQLMQQQLQMMQVQQQMMQMIMQGEKAAPTGKHGKTAVYAEDASDVLQWISVLQTDPEGLVTNLRFRYVAGWQDRAGGAALEDAFGRLRDWIMASSSAEGWEENGYQVELGNKLLHDVMYKHAWCKDRVPTGAIKQAVEEKSDDRVHRGIALARARTEQRRKWDATPKKGGKGFKGGAGKGRKGYGDTRGNVEAGEN